MEKKTHQKRDYERDRGAGKTGEGLLKNKGRQKRARKEKKNMWGGGSWCVELRTKRGGKTK